MRFAMRGTPNSTSTGSTTGAPLGTGAVDQRNLAAERRVRVTFRPGRAGTRLGYPLSLSLSPKREQAPEAPVLSMS